MNKKIFFILAIAILYSISYTKCSASGETTAAIDYSLETNWLNMPKTVDKPVDVFYLYPTVWTRADGESIFCDIDNAEMRSKAPLAFVYQATAFANSANIYAPFYRQVDSNYCAPLPIEQQDELFGSIPASDAVAAFDYYIKNYNNGRPFILAGHSQGSYVLLFLMSRYLSEHQEINRRMVAAYVIGYSVTDKYLATNPHLKFAEGAADYGVIISYNTEAPTVEGNNPVLLPGAQVINPINWTRDETTALASQNLGSLLPDKEGKPMEVADLADATVDKKKGVIICSTVDSTKYSMHSSMFGKGVFHSYDYPFYYFDLRANAAIRIASFLADNKQ